MSTSKNTQTALAKRTVLEPEVLEENTEDAKEIRMNISGIEIVLRLK